jgi:hypothetical protein
MFDDPNTKANAALIQQARQALDLASQLAKATTDFHRKIKFYGVSAPETTAALEVMQRHSAAIQNLIETEPKPIGAD